MFGTNIHNVTKVDEVRVNGNSSDESGWISIKVIAENYSWDNSKDQDQIPSEITLFFKNKKLGLSQLQASLALAIADDMVEEASNGS